MAAGTGRVIADLISGRAPEVPLDGLTLALTRAGSAVVIMWTCRIGMEATITPEDYPMVRIVPSRLENGSALGEALQALVYFGKPIHEFEAGLEALYGEMFEMEQALINAAVYDSGVYVIYVETILDEDRNDAYKLAALSVRIDG
ncbi:MAG: hypothetical protein MZW92_18890 [Comamonadaceae bacterium]|nr:hypothetical protein [Comamonadaceae bacterium]